MTGVLAHLAALRSTRPVLVPHADRSPADHTLRTETRDLVRQLPDARAVFWYEGPGPDEPDGRTGLMNVSETRIPGDATVFLCGPLPFMRKVRGQVPGAGVPREASATRSTDPICGWPTPPPEQRGAHRAHPPTAPANRRRRGSSAAQWNSGRQRGRHRMCG